MLSAQSYRGLATRISTRAALTAVIALAAIVRLLTFWLLPDQDFPDAGSYRTAAEEFWQWRVMTNPEIMPLYSVLIAIVGRGVPQALADIALSVISVWLVYAISLKIYADKTIALVASLFCALWPHFVFFSVVGLTETLFIALMLSALLALYSQHFVVGSIFLVLSILTRPALEPLAPFLILIFALLVHRRSWRFAMTRLGLYIVVYLAMMAPWWAHNHAKYDRFVRLNTAGGLVLYTGNNPMNVSGGGIGMSDVAVAEFQKIKDPVLRSNALTAAALDYIGSDPVHFVGMAGVKFLRLWRPWPHVEDYRKPLIIFVSLASFLPAIVLALTGLVFSLRPHWRRIVPCLAIIGFITAVHMVTFGSVRYRVPLEPFVLIFAAAGAVSLMQYLSAGRVLFPRIRADAG